MTDEVTARHDHTRSFFFCGVIAGKTLITFIAIRLIELDNRVNGPLPSFFNHSHQGGAFMTQSNNPIPPADLLHAWQKGDMTHEEVTKQMLQLMDVTMDTTANGQDHLAILDDRMDKLETAHHTERKRLRKRLKGQRLGPTR